MFVSVGSIVSESGASVYSASEAAQSELPHYDVSLRGAGRNSTHIAISAHTEWQPITACRSAIREHVIRIVEVTSKSCSRVWWIPDQCQCCRWHDVSPSSI